MPTTEKKEEDIYMRDNRVNGGTVVKPDKKNENMELDKTEESANHPHKHENGGNVNNDNDNSDNNKDDDNNDDEESEVCCHACGFEASYVPEGMLSCERCQAVYYCSLHCLQWDWKSGGHADTCIDIRDQQQKDAAKSSSRGATDVSISSDSESSSTEALTMAEIMRQKALQSSNNNHHKATNSDISNNASVGSLLLEQSKQKFAGYAAEVLTNLSAQTHHHNKSSSSGNNHLEDDAVSLVSMDVRQVFNMTSEGATAATTTGSSSKNHSSAPTTTTAAKTNGNLPTAATTTTTTYKMKPESPTVSVGSIQEKRRVWEEKLKKLSSMQDSGGNANNNNKSSSSSSSLLSSSSPMKNGNGSSSVKSLGDFFSSQNNSSNSMAESPSKQQQQQQQQHHHHSTGHKSPHKSRSLSGSSPAVSTSTPTADKKKTNGSVPPAPLLSSPTTKSSPTRRHNHNHNHEHSNNEEEEVDEEEEYVEEELSTEDEIMVEEYVEDGDDIHSMDAEPIDDDDDSGSEESVLRSIMEEGSSVSATGPELEGSWRSRDCIESILPNANGNGNRSQSDLSKPAPAMTEEVARAVFGNYVSDNDDDDDEEEEDDDDEEEEHEKRSKNSRDQEEDEEMPDASGTRSNAMDVDKQQEQGSKKRGVHGGDETDNEADEGTAANEEDASLSQSQSQLSHSHCTTLSPSQQEGDQSQPSLSNSQATYTTGYNSEDIVLLTSVHSTQNNNNNNNNPYFSRSPVGGESTSSDHDDDDEDEFGGGHYSGSTATTPSRGATSTTNTPSASTSPSVSGSVTTATQSPSTATTTSTAVSAAAVRLQVRGINNESNNNGNGGNPRRQQEEKSQTDPNDASYTDLSTSSRNRNPKQQQLPSNLLTTPATPKPSGVLSRGGISPLTPSTGSTTPTTPRPDDAPSVKRMKDMWETRVSTTKTTVPSFLPNSSSSNNNYRSWLTPSSGGGTSPSLSRVAAAAALIGGGIGNNNNTTTTPQLAAYRVGTPPSPTQSSTSYISSVLSPTDSSSANRDSSLDSNNNSSQNIDGNSQHSNALSSSSTSLQRTYSGESKTSSLSAGAAALGGLLGGGAKALKDFRNVYGSGQGNDVGPNKESVGLKDFRAVYSDTNALQNSSASLFEFRRRSSEIGSTRMMSVAPLLSSEKQRRRASLEGRLEGAADENMSVSSRASNDRNEALKMSINKALRDYAKLYGDDAARAAVMRLTQSDAPISPAPSVEETEKIATRDHGPKKNLLGPIGGEDMSPRSASKAYPTSASSASEDSDPMVQSSGTSHHSLQSMQTEVRSNSSKSKNKRKNNINSNSSVGSGSLLTANSASERHEGSEQDDASGDSSPDYTASPLTALKQALAQASSSGIEIDPEVTTPASKYLKVSAPLSTASHMPTQDSFTLGEPESKGGQSLGRSSQSFDSVASSVGTERIVNGLSRHQPQASPRHTENIKTPDRPHAAQSTAVANVGNAGISTPSPRYLQYRSGLTSGHPPGHLAASDTSFDSAEADPTTMQLLPGPNGTPDRPGMSTPSSRYLKYRSGLSSSHSMLSSDDGSTEPGAQSDAIAANYLDYRENPQAAVYSAYYTSTPSKDDEEKKSSPSETSGSAPRYMQYRNALVSRITPKKEDNPYSPNPASMGRNVTEETADSSFEEDKEDPAAEKYGKVDHLYGYGGVAGRPGSASSMSDSETDLSNSDQENSHSHSGSHSRSESSIDEDDDDENDDDEDDDDEESDDDEDDEDDGDNLQSKLTAYLSKNHAGNHDDEEDIDLALERQMYSSWSGMDPDPEAHHDDDRAVPDCPLSPLRPNQKIAEPGKTHTVATVPLPAPLRPNQKIAEPGKTHVVASVPVVKASTTVESLESGSHGSVSNKDNNDVDDIETGKPIGSTSNERAEEAPRNTRGRLRACCIVFLFLILGLALVLGLGFGLGLFGPDDSSVVTPDPFNAQGATGVRVKKTPSPTAAPNPYLRTQRPTASPSVKAPATEMATPTQSPATTPTPSDVNATLNSVLKAVSVDGGIRMMTEGTPENRAYLWLANTTDVATLSNDRLIQRYALASLFYSTNGESWTTNIDWVTESDECSWATRSFATKTCSDGMYVHLDLGLNGLSGSISPELALLSNLQSLDLDDNAIEGSLPTELGRMTSLVSFSMGGNRLTGEVPDELSAWTQLEDLDLSGNRLSGQLSDAVSQMVALTVLDLYDNQFGGEIAGDFFTLLSNLRELRMSDNKFQGALPDSIGQLKYLQVLSLDSNSFDVLPSDIGNMINLRSFSMNNNGMTGTLVTEIGSLSNLQTLDLHANNFTGPLPEQIGNLSNLENLDLSHNDFEGTIPESFGNMENMVNLQLQSNLLTGNVPSSIANLTKLALFRIDENNLAGALPDDLCHVFEMQMPKFYLDCAGNNPELICPPGNCCTYCCLARVCSCVFAGTNFEFLC